MLCYSIHDSYESQSDKPTVGLSLLLQHIIMEYTKIFTGTRADILPVKVEDIDKKHDSGSISMNDNYETTCQHRS